MNAKQTILDGKAVLGIELGSTRIKAVLVDEKHSPIASGSHDWENSLENGVWTYSLEDVWSGIQSCYADLSKNAAAEYGVEITRLEAIGISAMMHGHLAFDKDGKQLVPFRTWRNTMTEQAAAELTELFQYNVPQRWNIAHLYQAMLNKEEHVKDIAFLTTLAGYVHWKLTGKKVIGVGDASGMFPIDSGTKNYNADMNAKFEELELVKQYPWRLMEVLPQVLEAGDDAGSLTAEGARLLDTSGKLQEGTPLCPPEGDGGTGMVATNSVVAQTGNVSAGTSIFAMVVLKEELSKYYVEVDMVTTPDGKPVAMVHCNNCTSDLNAWADIMRGFASSMGTEYTMSNVLESMFKQSLNGDADCGGLLAYNYLSGEPITQMDEGRPLFVRTPNARFNYANFSRTLIYSALATLKLGMDILVNQEKVNIKSILGHGGFFKTEGVGQRLMGAALNTTISVMETTGEGGPWGMALLAAYMVRKDDGECLESYLDNKVFANNNGKQISPTETDVNGFAEFMEAYTKGLDIERAAVKNM